jgi:hypothetical protein
MRAVRSRLRPALLAPPRDGQPGGGDCTSMRTSSHTHETARVEPAQVEPVSEVQDDARTCSQKLQQRALDLAAMLRGASLMSAVSLGVRLGLYYEMREAGPLTSEALAARPRHTRHA